MTVNTILETVKSGKYNCLDEVIKTKYKDSTKYLYYSTVLYEQYKEYTTEPINNMSHVRFWEEEALSGVAYKKLLQDMKTLKIPDYDKYQLSFETTTVCCAHCTNCTHEHLIASKDRPNRRAEKEDIFYRIRKMKLLTKFFGGGKTERIILLIR